MHIFLPTNALMMFQHRNFISTFKNRFSFRTKGLRPRPKNRNSTSIFDDRTSLRAKGLYQTLQKPN